MEVLRGSAIAADVNYGRLDVNGRLVPRWHTAFSSHSFFYAALRACRTRAATPALRSVCTPRSLPQKSRFRLLIASPRPRLNALSPESREIHFAFVASFFSNLFSTAPASTRFSDFLFVREIVEFFLSFFFFFARERKNFWIIRRCANLYLCICIVEKEAGKNILGRYV